MLFEYYLCTIAIRQQDLNEISKYSCFRRKDPDKKECIWYDSVIVKL